MSMRASTSRRIAIMVPAIMGLIAAPGARVGAATETLEIDMERSYIIASTGKAGMLGFLGHRHGVLATEWTAEVNYDADAPENSSITIVIATAKLVIDTDEARRRARLAEDGPNESDLPGIQTRMLEEVLDVEQHVTIEFRSERIEVRGDNHLRVHGAMTLGGTTVPVTAEVWVRAIGGLTLFSARFEIKQTDFGIQPVSSGGVVNVADKIEIRFELWTAETTG